jgi:hypothetical protein
LFLISIVFQIALARHHKREKRFGPSPANGYTWGSRRNFWSRKKNNPDVNGADALPGHPTPADVEMDGEAKNEKRWYGFGRKNKTNAPTTATGGANGYGYGNSAYTGNY